MKGALCGPVGTHRVPIGALCEGSSMRLYYCTYTQSVLLFKINMHYKNVRIRDLEPIRVLVQCECHQAYPHSLKKKIQCTCWSYVFLSISRDSVYYKETMYLKINYCLSRS